MEQVSTPRIVSLIAGIALVIAVFTVPIVSFVAFGDTVGSHTLYEAVLDSYDRDSRTVQITTALVLLIVALALLAAHGLGFVKDRYALLAGLAAILSSGALIAFHASAQRIEILGYEVASTSLSFGTFVPAIIGVVALVAIRVVR